MIWNCTKRKYYDNNIHPIIIIKKLHSSNINKNKKLHCTENNNNINYFLKNKNENNLSINYY